MTISGNDTLFTKLERGLHAALRANQILSAIIAPGNWVDFTQPIVEPVRDSGVTADMPELRLEPSGLARQSHTSDCTIWVQSYTVMVIGGDKRTDEWHNRAKEGILNAVQAAKRSRLQLGNVVIDIMCPNMEEGPYNDDTGGTRHAGWVVRATILVRFTRADWEVPV